MKKSQLELALRVAGEVARDTDFIVFGSQSILGTVGNPPKACLLSMEVDLYPRRHPQALSLIVARLGARSAFSRKHGFFVDCVTPELAAFPDGWTERLTPFRSRRTGGVTGWCVELHDVAASKLAAGREKDLNYVRTLFAAKLIKAFVLENRVATLPVNTSHCEAISSLIKQLAHEARAQRKKEQS